MNTGADRDEEPRQGHSLARAQYRPLDPPSRFPASRRRCYGEHVPERHPGRGDAGQGVEPTTERGIPPPLKQSAFGEKGAIESGREKIVPRLPNLLVRD
jgi:hypothetical protein